MRACVREFVCVRMQPCTLYYTTRHNNAELYVFCVYATNTADDMAWCIDEHGTAATAVDTLANASQLQREKKNAVNVYIHGIPASRGTKTVTYASAECLPAFDSFTSLTCKGVFS